MDLAQSGILGSSDLQQLFDVLLKAGYTLIAPKLEGQCITYGEIKTINELPQGYTDEQEKGTYRLHKRNDKAYFGYNIGTRSFKDFLFPPREKLFSINKEQPTQILTLTKHPKYALIGVRACELVAIQIQDKVFMQGTYVDPNYAKRREQAFIVALNCHTTAKTCFCHSMNSGPEVKAGFDLNITEIINENTHEFIIEAGSEKGLAVFKQLPLTATQEQHCAQKKGIIERVQNAQIRKIDTTDIKEILYKAHNHAHWDKVAERCINCTNCTLVCPTCFCSKNEESTPIDQQTTTRTKVWDSCFSLEFTTIHDSHVRSSAKSRYRQWLTHKLGSWHDQFETSGCVGCGRCITFCPVGIDITEEFATIRDNHEDDI